MCVYFSIHARKKTPCTNQISGSLVRPKDWNLSNCSVVFHSWRNVLSPRQRPQHQQEQLDTKRLTQSASTVRLLERTAKMFVTDTQIASMDSRASYINNTDSKNTCIPVHPCNATVTPDSSCEGTCPRPALSGLPPPNFKQIVEQMGCLPASEVNVTDKGGVPERHDVTLLVKVHQQGLHSFDRFVQIWSCSCVLTGTCWPSIFLRAQSSQASELFSKRIVFSMLFTCSIH